ncbi:MAG: efflux RND transporter permease subunit [Mucinivorans sp.]
MVKKLITRPIAVTMCVIAIVVLGFVASAMLPVGLMPAVDIPQITVRVNAPNLSAREVAASVVQPLRGQLMQTSRLRSIQTESKDGGANISLKFEYGADIDYLFIDVNERIDKTMSSLPRDITRPSVVKTSATDIPAFYLNINAKEGGDMLDLSSFARTIISKRLEQLPQVAFVDISGERYAELVISLKDDFSELSPTIIENAIKASNINLGNLTIKDGQYQYNIRFSTKIVDKSDIERVVVNMDGRLFRVGELANVTLREQRVDGLIISDGKEALSMAVIKQSDAQMADLQREINSLVSQFEIDYPSVEFSITRDQTELLEYSIGNLEQNLIFGALLAALVLFLFMQDLRTPLLITITIPLSLIVSLLFFFIIGISINIISLSGLLLGLGMMVDNSIIVIDNVSQRLERGDKLITAVASGTEEVFAPMLSSVLTTCAIFIPLIFLSGIAGAMFYDQAMAVTIGLVSSLIVAMTIIPVYYYLFYRKAQKRETNKFLQKLNFVDYEALYERGLRWVFRHQIATCGMIVAMIVSSVFVYMGLEKRTIPQMDKQDVLLSVAWNEKITATENAKRTAQLVSSLGKIAHYTSMVGQQQFILSHTPELAKNEALIYVKSDSIDKVVNIANKFVRSNYPNAVFSSRESGNLFDMIFAEDEPMLLARLRPTSGSSPEPDKLNEILEKISSRLPSVPIEPVEWQEHITLYAQPELLSLHKVNYNDLYYVLRSAFNENRLFEISEGQFRIPVKMGQREQLLQEILGERSVLSEDKVDIPLRVLLRESRERDLKSIVSGTEGDFYPLPLNIPSNEVAKTMATVREVVSANPDFEVSFTGSTFTSSETTFQLVIVLIVSLLLLYFILAAQFESLLQPLIIMSEIVVDIFGALFLLLICGSSINIMSLIGIVVMCGIVINDSILKVDTINRLRRDGYSTLRAVLMGGRRRLKPIIMTSLTTILAIVPFLFAGGMGNDLQRPLSLTLIGGMVVGTLVSVFFIPMAYYYCYRRQ